MANETITRTVRADWKGSLRAEIHARECPPFFSDEPVGRGGLFEHPTPSEYLLSSLSGCSVAHVEMFTREIGMPCDDCHVVAGITMARLAPGDTAGPKGGILGLELDITVISSGTEDELERVKALFRAGCIMYLFMKSAVPVEDRWTLVQQG